MAAGAEPSLLDELFRRSTTAGAVSLRLFEGVHLCVTGLDEEERELVASLTERCGGQYSSELARGVCTHLLATRASTSAPSRLVTSGRHRSPV
jgi:hypothetical protein